MCHVLGVYIDVIVWLTNLFFRLFYSFDEVCSFVYCYNVDWPACPFVSLLCPLSVGLAFVHTLLRTYAPSSVRSHTASFTRSLVHTFLRPFVITLLRSLHFTSFTRGDVTQWAARLTRNVGVVGSSPIKSPRCFLEQETLPLLLST